LPSQQAGQQAQQREGGRGGTQCRCFYHAVIVLQVYASGPRWNTIHKNVIIHLRAKLRVAIGGLHELR
jgi:hypothetical protein